MKSIHTLIPDIQELLKTKGWLSPELLVPFREEITSRLSEQYGPEAAERKPSLRLSQLGPKCPRHLWYSIHHPELAEPMPPWANFKFSFGHVIEGLAVALAKAAGHSVVGEQDALTVDGILGHRDCVIDGCVVDVKSTTSFGFAKFKDGSFGQSDSFGYLDQLDAYLVGSAEDPLVTNKTTGYLLAVDKQLGHMCLYEHRVREQSIRNRIADYRRIVSDPTAPPCTCGTTPDGKSGNVRLDTKASYSPFKFCCFPSLRTFLYASGPVYLTKVVKVPNVPEINKYGKVISMPN